MVLFEATTALCPLFLPVIRAAVADLPPLPLPLVDGNDRPCLRWPHMSQIFLLMLFANVQNVQLQLVTTEAPILLSVLDVNEDDEDEDEEDEEGMRVCESEVGASAPERLSASFISASSCSRCAFVFRLKIWSSYSARRMPSPK